MKLQQLRSFIAVYEAGSVTAGATRIHATQSGLSMQIKNLEIQLGTALFERSVSGVDATENGHRFYQHAVSILREVAEAEHDMKSTLGEVTGNIRVGLIPTLTRTILLPVLNRFTAQYPLVKVSVVGAYSAQLTDDLAQGELDFAIVPAPSSAIRGNSRSQYLATDQEFLVSAPGQLCKHLEVVDLAKYGPQKLILPGPKNARRTQLDAYIHSQGIQIESIIELDGMLPTLELVASSDWKTFLPGLICIADKAGDTRQLNPLIGAPLRVDYVLIEPNASSLSTAAQLFAGMFKQEVNAQIHWHKRWDLV